MKYRLLLLVALICIALNVCAQNDRKYVKPDYAKIEQITKDPKQKTYYPKLYKRYESNDASLTVDDYFLLYYGSFFQDKYKGSIAAGIKYDDSVKAIFDKGELTNDDRKKLVRYTTQQLKSAPFEIRFLDRMYSLYKMLGDTANSIIYEVKLEMIAKTVFSTGDGNTDTTGIHVISVSDEYSIINLLGLKFGGSQSLTEHGCDYLTLQPNDDHLEGIYFDVTQIFKEYDKVFSSHRKHKGSKKGKKQ